MATRHAQLQRVRISDVTHPHYPETGRFTGKVIKPRLGRFNGRSEVGFVQARQRRLLRIAWAGPRDSRTEAAMTPHEALIARLQEFTTLLSDGQKHAQDRVMDPYILDTSMNAYWQGARDTLQKVIANFNPVREAADALASLAPSETPISNGNTPSCADRRCPVGSDRPICAAPEECCRELSRVWDALGITVYNFKSASENVITLRAFPDGLIKRTAREVLRQGTDGLSITVTA